MTDSLTPKQRFWFDHVERCEQSTLSMTAYAAEHDLDLKRFYNWKSLLAKRGVLKTRTVEARFTEVRVDTAFAGTGWRLRFPNGCVLESDQANASLLNGVLSRLSMLT